jgi:hypothetical protein
LAGLGIPTKVNNIANVTTELCLLCNIFRSN